MRTADSYRGARRNAAARARGGLRAWRRRGTAAMAANGQAKLAERSKQCAEARVLVLRATFDMTYRPGFTRVAAAAEALREFWLKQQQVKPTRRVSRILRELGPAPKVEPTPVAA